MTPDRIYAIKRTTGYSWKKLAHILNINESSVRRAAHGDYVLGGSSARMLEMLERGEVPARYLGEPVPARCVEDWTRNFTRDTLADSDGDDGA
jgi:hypothetical protein